MDGLVGNGSRSVDLRRVSFGSNSSSRSVGSDDGSAGWALRSVIPVRYWYYDLWIGSQPHSPFDAGGILGHRDRLCPNRHHPSQG